MDYSTIRKSVMRAMQQCTEDVMKIDGHEAGEDPRPLAHLTASLEKVLRQKLLFSPRLEYLYASCLASHLMNKSSAGSAVAALENDLTEKREEKEALTGRRMREIGRLKEQRDRLDREGREVVARIRKESFATESQLTEESEKMHRELEKKLAISVEEKEKLEQQHKHEEQLMRKERRKLEEEVHEAVELYDTTMARHQGDLDGLIKRHENLIEELERKKLSCQEMKKKHDAILEERRREEEARLAAAQEVFRQEHSARIIQRAWQHYKIKKMLKKAKRGRRKKLSMSQK